MKSRNSKQKPDGEPRRKTGWWPNRSPRLALLVLAVVAVASTWWGWHYFSHPRIQGIRNVVLISIDTCRADRLSCYGYPKPSTPNIDEVARDGVLFQTALTPVPMTTPAHSSMLTGTYPPTHGVRMNNGNRLADSSVTLAEVLRKEGYQTAAFVGGFPLDSQFGLNQGFGTYDCQFTNKNEKSKHSAERTAEEVNRPAMAWLEKNAEKPFFLFLHYFDAHAPYDPPQPYASKFADDLYAGEIAHVDHCIGKVIDRLRAMGVYDDTLVIITGDHGEGMGEHSERTHAFLIYQSTLHVPLVIKAPKATSGRQVDGNVSLVDIVPTVLDLVGLKIPPQVQGVNLRRSLEGGSVPDRPQPIYCESLEAASFGCSSLNGVVEGPWKYIRAPRQELYNLTHDPGERSNVVEKEPEVAKRLRGSLEAMLQQLESAVAKHGRSTVDPEALKKLGGLGYVDGGATLATSAFDPKLEDPKDFLSTYELLQKANGLFLSNRGKEAKKELIEIAGSRPRLITAHAILAQIALNERRLTDAAGYCEKIVSILSESKNVSQPDAGDLEAGKLDTRDLAAAHFNLAVILKEQGKPSEAMAHFEQALRGRTDSAEVRFNLGVVLAQTGKIPEAIGQYEQAVKIKPNYAEAHLNLGSILQQTGKLPEAIGHYEQVLRIKPDYAKTAPPFMAALAAARKANEALKRCEQAVRDKPADPEAQNNLGGLLRQSGQVPEAIGHFNEALRIKPDYAEAHYNLAMSLSQAGKFPEGVGHYKEALRLKPDFLPALNNLAWIRATHEDAKLRDGAEGVRLAEHACKITRRKEVGLLDTLAATYAESGRFPDAVATAEEALMLAKSTQQMAIADAIQSRLTLYRAGKPCREVTRKIEN